ncbi:unnamed protein product [Caenorhabditis brenneri]
MTKEHLVFKVKEGYVLQKDLESWYDNGLVEPHDRVQIIDKNNQNVDFKIETLIRINGSMYPFRRVKNFWRKVEKVQEILAESGRGSMEGNGETVEESFGNSREISRYSSRSSEKSEEAIPHQNPKESWKPEVRIQQEHSGYQQPLTRYQTDYHPHYVPLLNIPSLQSVMVFQNELIRAIQDMTLWPSGITHAAQLRVNWNCEFCKIPIFSELEAFDHICSGEHLAMMAYIAPACDLNYWKDWVAKVNTENLFSPQPLMDYCSFPQTPSRQIAVSPRVPMLDPLPYGWEYFRVTNAHERNVECWNALQRGGEATLRKARSQIVQWHCTYCSKHGHEVHLGNMLYAFRHIFSGSHWKNMNYITCHSDLQFWASWIDSVVEDEVVTYNPRVPPPATVALDNVPVARVVPMKSATVSQKEEKATLTPELKLLAAKSTVVQNEDLKPTVVQDAVVTLDTVDQIATVTPMEPADPVNTVAEEESAVTEQSESEKPETAVTKNMKNRQKSDKKKCCIQ